MATVGDVSSSDPKGTSIWSATTKKSSGAASGDLGKDDFMKLMLAQLQHQDPLKPMDDQAFIAQTAQFNALEEMTKLNKTLGAVLDSQQLAEASGLIGKTVSATDKEGKQVTGEVTAASVSGGVAMLHLGPTKIALDTVTAVASKGADLPAGDAPATASVKDQALASALPVDDGAAADADDVSLDEEAGPSAA
jgi:flagellar basal-body rod modification protein FlgD